jgi:hypothetical protein
MEAALNGSREIGFTILVDDAVTGGSIYSRFIVTRNCWSAYLMNLQ